MDATSSRGPLAAGGKKLAFLQGEMHHQDLWLMDLETGAERQLTHLAPGYDIRDIDVSPGWP
jgi:hypothetical protein